MKFTRIPFFLFSVCVFAFLPLISSAQYTQAYNLTIDNGLPSDRVYGMITDQHGYLWIGTEKGVVRYNGYQCKVFNMADGLPSEDIWGLTEDKRGRIWLSNISDEVGYLYNGKYYKSYLQGLRGTVYPTFFRRRRNGIVFQTGYGAKNGQTAICFEENDTIRSVPLHQSIFSDHVSRSDNIDKAYFLMIDESGKGFAIFGNTTFAVDYDNLKKEPVAKPLALLSAPAPFYPNFINLLVGNLLLSYAFNERSDTIYTTSITTGRISKVTIGGVPRAKVQYIYPATEDSGANTIYIVTGNDVIRCVVDSSIRVVEHLDKRAFLNNSIKDIKITTVHKDKFWNYCVGTPQNGVWLNQTNEFKSVLPQGVLDNYSFVGHHNNDLSFWWNKAQSRLAVADTKMHAIFYDIPGVNQVRSVCHYSGDTFLICAAVPHFFLRNSGRFIRVPANDFGDGLFAAIVRSRDELVFVASFSMYSVQRKNGTFVRNTVDVERFTALAYDSLRHEYYAHNNIKLLIHGKNHNKVLDKKTLNTMGVNSLQSICIDNKFGNVFLKGYENIVMLDRETNRSVKIFGNYNFKEASDMILYGDKLIVVSKYGVVFGAIQSKMKISQPFFKYNSKNVAFKILYGSCVVAGNLVLNTDKGVFTVAIPSTQDLNSNTRPVQAWYRFILNYRDTVRRLSGGDTIVLDQKHRSLLFDLILPLGNGAVKYYYTTDTATAYKPLNSNELNITSEFLPGVHYRLFIYAADQAINTNVVPLHFYIRPYWWQTPLAQKLMWLGGALLGLLVIFLSVVLTRRLVLRAAVRRQLRMELELKAIHAQINPHFIFNSLNSALLLVNKNRMEEAYSHISKFSRLLRSYLKSSRNKFISLREEVENLRNYIELQQTRFKDKFEYEIYVDSQISMDMVSIPSLLIQPFVENAINHGILPGRNMGHLLISFTSTHSGKTIMCTIDDNGIGRRMSLAGRSAGDGKDESYGNLMIKDLINIFNKYEDMHIDIQYIDKELPATGTIVKITMKNPK